MTFKPMLSGTCEDMSAVKFPVLASPKLDGIRCIMLNGVPVSRNLKPIRNKFVQKTLTGLPFLDGELIVGSMTAKNQFSITTSGVMSEDGEPDFTFHVFDQVIEHESFIERLAQVKESCDYFIGFRLKMVPHVLCTKLEELVKYEASCVHEGYEGIMIRDPHGAYKFGRSTVREGGLLKIKRWIDEEARIVGFKEQLHNANEATKDNLGRTKRSMAKAGKTGKNTLGAFLCERLVDGINFDIGTGMDDALKAEIWANQDVYIKKLVKFKYQEIGVDGRPRFPVFLGFRDLADLD